MPPITAHDPEVAALIARETARQNAALTLVASENYASHAVLAAAGSALTNKYADGYPGARDYPGCEVCDDIETLARERLCRLFGAGHANVQPYSGSVANLAVYCALLNPGDRILSMKVEDGGHHTHGSPEHLSGRLYRAARYGVDPATGLLDYAEIAAAVRREQPALLICGGSFYPRTIDFGAFAEIADEAGTLCLADIAHLAGLIAGGQHPSPAGAVPLITTTTHKTLRGPRGGAILCDAEYAEEIDAAVYPCLQGGPLMHIIAAKAVCCAEAMTPAFKDYSRRVVANAKVLATALAAEGFSPFTGGTDTHLLVLDLAGAGIRGCDAEGALSRAGIAADRCPVPGRGEGYDTAGGIRLGTPAATTRGMGEEEMKALASLIAGILRNPHHPGRIGEARREVAQLARTFPVSP
ncbi:MAG: serine hydroxymethyltransferase [Methanomicrobiaceae archaeon]|nr:serine hydroxymethyltransferase [Methanomicrobiaceae archaeon]